MRLGCFGKLPFYPDFIRINGGDFSSVDQWFQKGIMLSMQKWGREWPERFRKSPRYKFIFQGSDNRSGKALSGAFVPGEDRGGRTFPFTVFTEAPKTPLKDLGRAMEVSEEGFLNRIGTFFDNGLTGDSLSEFQDAFRDWQSGGGENAAYNLTYRDRPVGDFWKESFGSFDDRGKYLVVKNLIDIMAPFKKTAPPGSFPGFRIPFKNDALSPSVTALFWTSLVRAVAGSDNLIMSVIWHDAVEQRHQPCIYFFTGEPTPKSFIQLVDPASGGDAFPTDLSKVRADRADELEKRLDPKIKLLLGNPDIDLSSFLAALGNPG